jgi:hypothetical protein
MDASQERQGRLRFRLGVRPGLSQMPVVIEAIALECLLPSFSRQERCLAIGAVFCK